MRQAKKYARKSAARTSAGDEFFRAAGLSPPRSPKGSGPGGQNGGMGNGRMERPPERRGGEGGVVQGGAYHRYVPRDSGRESREGETVFNFIRRTRAGKGTPSGNFESNRLSDHRLRKQMSVDFVVRRRSLQRCP